MSTTGRVTAAPTPIRFNNGKDYLFTPLSDKDFDTLDEWLQAKYVENGMKGIPEEWPEEKQNAVINAIVKESLKITFLTQGGLELLSTLQGMTFVSWLSLRKEQPTLTLDQVRELLILDKNLKLVNQAFRKVNAVPENPHRAGARNNGRKKRR
jgi:hypothetical protein